VYTEDDTHVTAEHIQAFLAATEVLPRDLIAGFLRYEVDAAGSRHCCTMHSHFRWLPESVRRYGDMTVGRYTNDHSGCYMLTRQQLSRVIASGGYATREHTGRYAMLESAATDPYVYCGITKVIPISHVDSFLIHHMANAYLGKLGVPIDELKAQVDFLMRRSREPGAARQLFDTEKRLPSSTRDKLYHEEHDRGISDLIPSTARSVLCVGAGIGRAELSLIRLAVKLTAIPLDEVVGNSLRRLGVTTTVANLEEALQELSGCSFDVIVLQNTLQHVQRPVELLVSLRALLGPEGRIVGSVPNLSRLRLRKGSDPIPGGFRGRIHRTTAGQTKRWARRAGLQATVRFLLTEKRARLSRISLGTAKRLLTTEIVFLMRDNASVGRPVGGSALRDRVLGAARK
jgi:2-polyprenyl-3-methyl-5-hydroxy-6-metoxy-1,4-benzoquinol methylase